MAIIGVKDSSLMSLLQSKDLYLSPEVTCHLPFEFVPPVRLYGGCITNHTTIDAFSYVAPGAFLHRTKIGRYCSIGDRVNVLSNHPTNRLSTHPFTYENIFGPDFSCTKESLSPYSGQLPVTQIGHDVWIGSGARIKSGVVIGNGSIIGAGSVVTKDVPPYSIVGGAPAKIIRMRFDDVLIFRLQMIQWWQYNLIGLKLSWDNVSAAMDELEELITANKIEPYAPKWIRLV